MDTVLQKLETLDIRPLGSQSFRRLQEWELKTLEDRIGAELPAEYRGILAKYGQSSFLATHSLGPLFGSFYGFKDFLTVFSNLKSYLPSSMVGFGDCGNLVFCLGVKGNDVGRVFYWNEHTGCFWDDEALTYADRGEEVPDQLRYQNVTEISPSFSKFIQELEPYSEP